MSEAAVKKTLAVYRRWLHLPDPGAVLVALGAFAANRLPGCPVWLLQVGAPGSGKTEPLTALAKLPDAHAAGTLTEASLLSGTPRREKATKAKGGLLREIGDFGVIVAKDFTSVLNMSRDARASTLAALREVFDGSWTRHVGTDGGRTLAWQGKVGLIGGVTPTIDRSHAVMAAMGERFLLYRLPTIGAEQLARTALRQSGSNGALMREELAAATAALLARSEDREPRSMSEKEETTLVELATLIARIRSSVERDGYSREIELIPDAEVPTRLVLTLAQLLAGLDVLGVERATALDLVRSVARASAPAVRVSMLDLLARSDEPLTTTAAGQALRYPTSTTRRTLEDLQAHGLVLRVAGGKGKADSWLTTTWTDAHWPVLDDLPRNSSSHAERERDRATSDISGTVAHSTNKKPNAAQEAAGKEVTP
jgi:IclR helix-turn-helix domain